MGFFSTLDKAFDSLLDMDSMSMFDHSATSLLDDQPMVAVDTFDPTLDMPGIVTLESHDQGQLFNNSVHMGLFD